MVALYTNFLTFRVDNDCPSGSDRLIIHSISPDLLRLVHTERLKIETVYCRLLYILEKYLIFIQGNRPWNLVSLHDLWPHQFTVSYVNIKNLFFWWHFLLKPLIIYSSYYDVIVWIYTFFSQIVCGGTGLDPGPQEGRHLCAGERGSDPCQHQDQHPGQTSLIQISGVRSKQIFKRSW